MSTRMSLWWWRGLHVYVEMLTGWVRLGVGTWLDVGLYPQLRSVQRPAWLGRLACRLGYHDWLLDATWVPWGSGPATYQCMRCGARGA